MADIAVDGSNDIIFKNGDLLFTSDISYGETVRSRLQAYLKTFLGEWFLDDRRAPVWGMPYYQRILTDRRPTELELDTIFRSAILGTDGIQRVDSLELEIAKRVLTVTFEATLADETLINDTIEIAIGV
jgi:hypothetical protein